VTTNGKTTGPGKPKRTRAQVQAKFNALNALKQSAGAALYPCGLVVLGTTLVVGGPVGIAVGGVLIGSGQGMCVYYYVTMLSEARTVGDPPRADYERVAAAGRTTAVGRSLPSCGQWHGAVLGACQRARSAAAKLLAAAGDTANAARAIELTISRESGAQRAHDGRAVARQNGALIDLSRQFEARRRAERAAGDAFAKVIRQAGDSVGLTQPQSVTAAGIVLNGLKARRLPAADLTLVGRLLPNRALDVLATLGR
jgi:hypothetical protein